MSVLSSLPPIHHCLGEADVGLAVPQNGDGRRSEKDAEEGTGLGRVADFKPPRVPFGQVCETLASTVNTDNSVLLLYLLLHRNDLFRAFVMETQLYEKFVSPYWHNLSRHLQ